uniref:Uncharacterized protein n=1 Tax=Emiliania huxleyi TaxID=2903 RepID=A0A7S3TTK1_EMIHU
MKRTPPAAAVRDGTATSRRRGAEAADRLRVLDSNMDSLLLCSMAICGFCGWGWYLFDMGTSDFRIGLDAAGTSDSCSWKPQLEALDRLIPFLLIVRAATLPHLWHTLGAQPRRWMVALLTPACIGFLFALVLPLAWVTALVLQPGLQSVFNFNETLQQWPTGCTPNVMFYQPATELLKLRAYSYWVQLETDSVPLRPRWLEYLAARIPPRTDGFWVKGSAPRHHCSWCNLEEGYHINGNALYNARDEAFLAFIQRTWSVAGNHTEPYDVALFERARSSDRSI